VKIDDVNDDVYLVPISSEFANFDATCVIMKEDGVPDLTVKSFAAYFHAKKCALTGMKTKIRMKEVKILGQVPETLLARVIEGICSSDDTEKAFRKVFRPPAAPRRILRSD
jgi:hypothetical protein